MKSIIKNGKIIIPDEILYYYDLAIEDGVITGVLPRGILKEEDFDEVIDAKENYVSPGFIDIHTHGNSGHDTMDGTFNALESQARFHIKNGVTAFLATTITASSEETKKVLKTVADYMSKQNPKSIHSAEILGIYLEGPYFSPAKKGAQPLKFLKSPDTMEISEFIELSKDNIRVVALAPELPGALEAVKYLKSLNIAVSAGHTNASFDEAKVAIDMGITLSTHTFNAMKNFTHREPGIVGAVLTDDRVFCEMICDGIHLHPAVMKLMVRAKGADKVVLVSDSMMAAGLPDGDYKLGGQRVIVKDMEARLSDGTLAGSTLTLDRAVYNAVHKLEIPLHDAVRMASLSPAKAIGISHKKGSIELDKDADIIIFDENINILKVIKGKQYTIS